MGGGSEVKIVSGMCAVDKKRRGEKHNLHSIEEKAGQVCQGKEVRELRGGGGREKWYLRKKKERNAIKKKEEKKSERDKKETESARELGCTG